MKETVLRRPLEQLVDYGLLVGRKNSYQVRHALIHSYIRERLPVGDDVVLRIAKFYATYIQQRWEYRRDRFSTLAKQQAHIAEVMSVCVTRKMWDVVTGLVLVINESYSDTCQWIDPKVVLALGLIAANEKQAHKEEKRWLHALTVLIGTEHDAKSTTELSRKLVLTYLGQQGTS